MLSSLSLMQPSQLTQPQQLQTSTLVKQQQLNLSSEPQSISIGELNEKQLAAYDMPNASEIRKQYDSPTIQHLFDQFNYQCYSFFKQRAIQNKAVIDLNKRKNISVLVIIGSSIFETRSTKLEGAYLKNSEDLSSAILIRHLFHNAFGIPYEQILITSTQNSDFYVGNTKFNLISEPKSIFDGDEDINPVTEKIYFKFLINDEIFELNQNINISQVRDKNFKFLLTEKLSDIVKPFNINIIKNELNTNKDSHLLVFFLDHGYVGGFGSKLPYQFFIERLLQIECKHFYVFSDSCCSGSLIKLIDICTEFQKIFPDIENPVLESALFFFLTNLNKVPPEYVKIAIDDKIDKIDSNKNFNLSEDTKNNLISILKNIEAPKTEKISQFVLKLGEFSSSVCIPQHFLMFSKKATIFSSSEYNQISLTLPGRKINISYFEEPKIRVFGSVFTSILIESFLHKTGQLSLKKFSQCVCDLFRKYKSSFIDIITSQNEFIHEEIENYNVPNKQKIIDFFSSNPCDKSLLFVIENNYDWPDFSSIMLEEKYWNIDISDVDISEYKDVFFCMFKIHDSEPLIENPNNYGPEKGTYHMFKFLKDFENEVKIIFEKNHMNAKFTINYSTLYDKLSNINTAGYGQFISSIRSMINCYDWQAIDILKNPMTDFFNENPNNIIENAQLFAEAFKNIIIFWKEYEF